MPWSTLGTLSPDLVDWQTLNAPAEGELFRFSQSWVGEWPGTGYIRLRLLYADDTSYEDGYFETQRLYASRDEQLLVLPFNLILGQAGYNVRYFQARLNLRARTYANANWQVNIDQFIGDSETLDGGEYV
jgi:hypothetical protein